MGDRPDNQIINDLFDMGLAVLVMQEMADQDKVPWIRRAEDKIDWFWPDKPPGAKTSNNIDENPIAWDRRKVHHVKSGSKHLTDRKEVGDNGPGGSTMHEKWLNWVTLLELETNRQFIVGNIHYVPAPKMERRESLMRTQVKESVEWAGNREDSRIVILSGDTNCDLKDPDEERFLNPLWRAGFESCWRVTDTSGGSFQNQQLDQVMLRENGRAKITDMEVPNLGFDHKPVIADIRFRAS